MSSLYQDFSGDLCKSYEYAVCANKFQGHADHVGSAHLVEELKTTCRKPQEGVIVRT